MSERPFMQLYVSDFLGDTLHLSTEQIGAYMLLLMAMWNAGGSLPDDDAKLARVVRMSVKKWRAIAGDMMAFFDREDGRISHHRLTKELQKSESKSQSRASAGAKGGDAKALKDNDARVANATVLPQHLPDTITREEPIGSSNKHATSALGGFDDWYRLYPHKVQRGAAERAWPKACSLSSIDDLIAGLRRYIDSKPADRAWQNPATWLNGKGWLDEPARPVARGSPSRPLTASQITRARLEGMSKNDDRPPERSDKPALVLIPKFPEWGPGERAYGLRTGDERG